MFSKVLLFVLIALTTVLVCLAFFGDIFTSSSSVRSKPPAFRPSDALHPILEIHPEHWHRYMDWWHRSQNQSAAKASIIDANETAALFKSINSLRGPPDHDLPHRSGPLRVDTETVFKPNLTLLTPLPLAAHPLASALPAEVVFDESRRISAQQIAAHHACANQTTCYPSYLQLQRTYKIYNCKHLHYGVRFYFLVREGLLLHPAVTLVDSMAEADYIIYLPESSSWDKSECSDPKYHHKLVVLDEGDYPHAFQEHLSDQFFLMFKRSYVKRSNGQFQGYMSYLSNMNILPMTYPVAEAYLKPRTLPMAQRALEIVCSLRGGDHDPTRRRVKDYVVEYGKSRRITNIVAGEVSSASRTTINVKYFQQMATAKIVITSNPSHWEGDFRFGEALGSGAVIFIDEMYVPRQHPFKHGVHVVYYSNNNKTDLFLKLDQVRADPMKQEQLSLQGFIHGLTFHRTTNLLDYILRTVHIKERALQEHS